MPDRLLHFLEGVSSEYKREIEPFSQSTASVSHWLLRESLAIGCHPENPPTKSLCDVIKKTLKSHSKKKTVRSSVGLSLSFLRLLCNETLTEVAGTYPSPSLTFLLNTGTGTLLSLGQWSKVAARLEEGGEGRGGGGSRRVPYFSHVLANRGGQWNTSRNL